MTKLPINALRKLAFGQLPAHARRLVTLTTTDLTLDDSEGPEIEQRPERVEAEVEHALLLSAQNKASRFSIFDGNEPGYSLLLDLDVPAALIPSSTEGHSHLIVAASMTKAQHDAVMTALCEAGVIQPGYAVASRQSRFGATLRLPWVRKGSDKPLLEPAPVPSPAAEEAPAA